MGEVAPVVVVAHAVQVEVKADAANGLNAGINIAFVCCCQAPAIAATQLVRGHEVGAHPARIGIFKVAKLRAQIETAFGHQRGAKGGVPIRGNIPVIRNRDLRAVDVAKPQGGRQKPRLATIAQREAQVRHWQDGHPLEAKHRAFGLTNVFFVVQVQGGGPQNPVGQPARASKALAGGECGVVDDHPFVVNEVHTISFTMPVILKKVVARLVEETFKRFNFELYQGPLKHIACAIDAHVAARFGQVIGLVVLQPVSTNHRVTPAQYGIAFQHGF